MQTETRPQIAAYLDVENLLHECDITELERVVDGLGAEGDVIQMVAVGHPSLMAQLVPIMQRAGIRGHVHPGGPDAADEALIDRMEREMPARVDTVVIVSGDHIFAPVARRMRAAGRRVIVIARFRGISARLYAAASEVRVLPAGRGEHVG